MSDDVAFRRDVLSRHGAGTDEIAELLEYNANRFDRRPLLQPLSLPLPPEPHVEAWRRYAADAEGRGVVPALRSALVQLRFPVRPGLAATDGYRAATRRGALTDGMGEATGLELRDPARVRLELHEAPAGIVPLIVAGARSDFVALVQALTCRNEPDPVPDSMGACMVVGYNNWERIAGLRAAFERSEPGGDWEAEFQRIVPQKALYQDRFIILSEGPYSGVAAAELGVPVDDWLALSLRIRTEHECTHYFTRRLLGTMRNNALDETIADYMGIVAAAGRFRADWFLRFLGLDAFPGVRQDGRLANYRGTPPLSDRAFTALCGVVHAAAHALERFDAGLSVADRTARGRARVLAALTGQTLEALASEEGEHRLRAALDEARRLTP